MNNQTILEMNNAIVKFLVHHGSKPSFKDSDKDKIKEAEDKLKDKLRRAQTGLEASFVDELEKQGYLPENEEDRQSFIDKIMGDDLESMRDKIAEGSGEAAEIAREKIIDEAKDQGMDVDFSGYSEDVLDELKNKNYEFSKETIDNIKGDFKGTLSEAYEDGIGIDDVAERLEKDFDSLRESRLKTIARTEIQNGQNKGNFQTLKDIGAEYKQWLTAEDDSVRESHVDVHGEVVKIDEEFTNGLQYPGDRSGDPSDTINCRCVMRPYIPNKSEDISSTPYYP